jgi:hypothetical protein
MKPKPKRPFFQRLFIFCSVAFIVYSVVGFILAPVILKNQLEKRLPAELGRPVRIESIRVNPWILSMTIEGLAISDPDGGPFVAWDRVYVNFDPTTFFVKEWRFQEITAIAPSGRVIIDDKGVFNFADLLEKFAPKADEPEKAAWPLRVAKLVVNGARLDFADHSRSQEFATQVGPVNFALVQFYTSPNRDAPYQFTAETESGEKLSWSGTLSVNPVASEGELQVSGIRPGKYAPYYRDLIRFDVLDGTLDVSGRYKASLSDAGNVALLNDGRVHLMGFKIAPRGTTAPALELHDLELNGIEADATAITMKAAKVAVTGGNASVRRDQEGTIDLLAMLMPVPSSADTTTTPSPSQDRPKPQVEIASFSVRQFRATFDDLSTPRPARNTLENIDVDVEKLTLAEGASMPLRIAVTLPRTGSANVSGNFVLSPLQATLAVNAANVSLASLSPYIEPMVNVHLTKGAVSTNGEARVALPENQPMELEYKGDLTIDQFGAVDGVRNEELVGWSKLAVTGIDFKGMPVSVAIKEITWTDPKAHVLINPDGSINLLAALEPAPGPESATEATSREATTPPAEQTPLPKISIGSVKLTNGAFTFADRSVQPEVSTAINQFGGTITGLSSENMASADVDLKATVGGSGPVTISGKLNPLGENKLVDLKVDIENVELTPFSPYSGKFAGFELARGKLFVDVDAKVQNETVDMSNVVTLTQFTFGAPTQSPDATKLPVRLAVALLKDTEGKITLDVPVQGRLSDPSFRIGKVVAGVIGNLLTKVATSPFSLLGAMFGGGGEELAFQEFAPGEAELTPDNLKKLETLTKALKARPALNLEITGSFDAAADGQVLKLERLAQKVRSRLWDERRAMDADVPPPDQMVITPEDELAMIQKLFAEAFPDSAPELTAVSPPPAPEPVAVEEKKPERRGFFRKAADIVTLKAWRDGDSDEDEEEKTVAAPPPTVESSAAVGPAWPSVEEMKAKLAETIEVTTDDHRRIAARRAERVREHFIQQEIAGERLFLANVNAEGKGARVFLQLQ